jgi:hypothetical protein
MPGGMFIHSRSCSCSCSLCIAVIAATCALPMGKVTLSESVYEAGQQAACAARHDWGAPPVSAQSGEQDREPDETPKHVVSAVLSDAWDRTTRDGARPVAVTRVSCWTEPQMVSDPAWSQERFNEVRTVTPQEAGTLPILTHAPPAPV